jgi:hypothetical protein
MSAPETLGPGPVVDAPDRWQKYGYIVRWRARRQFLGTATALVPDLLSSLLTEDAIDWASETPAWHHQVTYPKASHGLGSLLEQRFFSRNDGLLMEVDWSNFDPELDPHMTRLHDREQAFLRNLGRAGIAAAWNSRKVERTDLGISVWQALTLFSQSESDGDPERDWLRSISPSLWHHVSDWTRRWHLDRPWAFMVAIATICDAARRKSNGDPVSAKFTVPNRWESWYVEQTGTFAGPERAKRPQRRRSSRGDHMEWLVQRHFLQYPAETISSTERVSQQAIDNKTRQLAKLIGLDLQLAIGGRPRRRTARTIKVPPKNRL